MTGSSKTTYWVKSLPWCLARRKYSSLNCFTRTASFCCVSLAVEYPHRGGDKIDAVTQRGGGREQGDDLPQRDIPVYDPTPEQLEDKAALGAA